MTARHPAEYRTLQAQRRRRGRAIRKAQRHGYTTRQARAALDALTEAWEVVLDVVRIVWDRIKAVCDAVIRWAAMLRWNAARQDQSLTHNGRKPR